MTMTRAILVSSLSGVQWVKISLVWQKDGFLCIAPLPLPQLDRHVFLGSNWYSYKSEFAWNNEWIAITFSCHQAWWDRSVLGCIKKLCLPYKAIPTERECGGTLSERFQIWINYPLYLHVQGRFKVSLFVFLFWVPRNELAFIIELCSMGKIRNLWLKLLNLPLKVF